ncbi:MAG: hypothetical protein ACRENL_04480 [Candidatus Dormibacteria bacterium]
MPVTTSKQTVNGVAAEAAGAGPNAVTPERTVHERKLAVMAKCGAISRDASYVVQGRKVEYVSITHLCDSLRRFCVEEGLDVISSIHDGEVTVTLVNAAAPEQTIVSTWPVVAQDRGWSYSIKYPLIRLFLVGDGEEDDASGAQHSAAAASGQRPQPVVPSTPAPGPNGDRSELVKAVMAMPSEPRMTVLKDFGYRSTLSLRAWIDQLDEDVAERLAVAIGGGASDDDIPW